MPAKLSTTVAKISLIPNEKNRELVTAFYGYLKENNASERHQNNQLKLAIPYAVFLGPDKTLLDVQKKEEILAFLDTKIKTEQQDPEKRWITTWNDYSNKLKFLFRWIHNQYGKDDLIPTSEWQTPAFGRIRLKKTNRISPYSESEIWDRSELLTVVKYASTLRDKAALTLAWDLDARNHEVTSLKIKNIRLRDSYAEGEVNWTSKTGSGPILLVCSFPYVRDLLAVHPRKYDPEATIICDMRTGNPIQPDALWQMMHLRLRSHITYLLETGAIGDEKERETLKNILEKKRFNPYAIRHSAITYDGDFLPEFALRRKVRWSMNSKQPARYMKRRMGTGVKSQILAREGIVLDESLKEKPAVRVCPKCNYVNACEYSACKRCDWPLSKKVLKEIEAGKNNEIESLRQELEYIREDYGRISDALGLVRRNPDLAKVKPKVLKQLKVA